MGRPLASLRRHPWRTAAASALVLLVAGVVANRDLVALVLSPDEPVELTLPLVEPLAPGAGEVVYRVDAARSSLRVEVDEVLAGVDSTAVLTTRGIAGDVAVGDGGRAVRLGDVAVDVHQLTSDNSLRDKAIRHEYLESHAHRQVRLVSARVTLPAGATARAATGAVVEGNLVVKGVERPTRWEVDARLADDTLTATARTTVRMSDFGVGPISKAGLVRTSDEVDLTLRLVAVDGRSFEPPMALELEDVAAVGDDGGPSFSRRVQPILEANCASCHRPGAVGASMWELADAGDAADVADGLAVVTGAGYMPPWPPSADGIPLRHDRELSPDQVRTLREWASAGGRLDVPRRTPVRPPVEPEVEVPRADVVVQLPEPYVGDPAVRDDYRCFVLDPQRTERSFLTGYTFEPDSLEVVHHALVYRRSAADRARVDQLDADDAGPGWSCVAGMGASSTGGALVAGWVPGQRPMDFGEDEGFEFRPGDFLVAQIHYHYDAGAPPDRSGMTLEFTTDPATTPLVTRTLVGPVELPCPAGSTGVLCDREAALADVTERFGPGGRRMANGLHLVCGTTPDEVAARSDGTTATTTCDYPVTGDGEIVDLLGHMHEIGSAYRMTLNPGTDREQVLLDIPVWDFDWQLNYQPVQAVPVAAGDTIRVTCSWDRRLRHDPEPRWIVFAEGTTDEMCFSTVTVRPRGGSTGAVVGDGA